MDTDIFESHESEVMSYARSFPVVFDQAKGSYLYDETGKEYTPIRLYWFAWYTFHPQTELIR